MFSPKRIVANINNQFANLLHPPQQMSAYIIFENNVPFIMIDYAKTGTNFSKSEIIGVQTQSGSHYCVTPGQSENMGQRGGIIKIVTFDQNLFVDFDNGQSAHTSPIKDLILKGGNKFSYQALDINKSQKSNAPNFVPN